MAIYNQNYRRHISTLNEEYRRRCILPGKSSISLPRLRQSICGLKIDFWIYLKQKQSKQQDILSKAENPRPAKARCNPQDPSTSTLSFGVNRSIQFILPFALPWLVFVSGFTLIWWLPLQFDDVLLKNPEAIQSQAFQ